MTSEEIKELSKWEGHFRLALKANFVRMSTSEFGEFAADYAKFFPALTKSQMVCNTCRLNSLKTLGTAYFRAKQELAEQQAKEDNNGKPAEKKKAGRPRKIQMEE